MAMKTGVRLDYKQDPSEEIMAKAKAEARFSERLYEILFEYQERMYATGNQAWTRPLKESERVGELNLPLSRLYNQIWSEMMGFSCKGKNKKNKQQMEVSA